MSGSVGVGARVVGRLLLRIGLGALAGAVAGLIAGGGGSRLAMRLVAILAGPEHHGRLTEAQARIGEITGGGTVFLLFAGTALGLIVGPSYLIVRSWLPGTSWRRGLVFGGLILVLLGHVFIRGENFDFDRFISPFVTVPLFAVLPLGYGAILAPLVDRFAPTAGTWTRHRVVRGGGYALLGLLLIAGAVQDARQLAMFF